MSYTVETPSQKPRPSVVSASSLLLYVLAGLMVVSAGLSGYADWTLRGVSAGAQTAEERQISEATATVSLVASLALYLALAVGFVVVGILIGKGKQAARIVTWVLAGLTLLCNGCGLIATAFQDQLLSQVSGGQDVADEINATLPGWVNPVSLVVDIVAILGLVAVIILLTMPAANEFFRREQEVWIPPTWPAEGGYPPPLGGVASDTSPPGGPTPPGPTPPGPTW